MVAWPTMARWSGRGQVWYLEETVKRIEFFPWHVTSRLNNVVRMSRDYHLLTPSDPPPQTGPQEQGAPASKSTSSPTSKGWSELPMPPVVYVPCTPGDDGINHLAYRNLDDGRVALLVYTALDRLIDLAGDVHWALLDWDALQQAQNLQHYDLILQDVWIPEDRR